MRENLRPFFGRNKTTRQSIRKKTINDGKKNALRKRPLNNRQELAIRPSKSNNIVIIRRRRRPLALRVGVDAQSVRQTRVALCDLAVGGALDQRLRALRPARRGALAAVYGLPDASAGTCEGDQRLAWFGLRAAGGGVARARTRVGIRQAIRRYQYVKIRQNWNTDRTHHDFRVLPHGAVHPPQASP